MENENKENFYLLLNLSLDPPVTDRAKLEAAVRARVSEWNRMTVGGAGAGNLQSQKYAQLAPKILETLTGDPVRRDAVIKEALSIQKKRLAELLDVVAKSGSCSEAQLKHICKQIPQFTEATIRKMVKVDITADADSGFEPPKKPADPPILPLDGVTMERYVKNLDVVGVPNVYVFLFGKDMRTVTPKSMCERARDILDEIQHSQDANNAVSNARQTVARMVIVDFAKPNAKEAYDLALRKHLAQTQLQPKFELRCAGAIVKWQDYLDSVDDCLGVGMTKEEAEWYVYDYFQKVCRRKKCSMPLPPSEEKPRARVTYCPSCFAANPENATSCAKCGQHFQVKCPKCGKQVSVKSPYCPNCSFPIGDMPLADMKIRSAGLLLANGRLNEAERAVSEALVYWPGNVEAERVRGEIAKRREAERAAAERAALAAREAAARGHLDNISLTGALSATVERLGAVRLQWPRAAVVNVQLGTEQNKISYCVVRKEGGVPAAATDGERLAETQLLAYEDTKAVPGVVYGYGVFPCYCGVPRKAGAVSSKVVTVADVTDLQVQVDSGTVRLHWKNPPHAAGTICVRKQGGAPLSPRDGTVLNVAAGETGLVDTGLANRMRYGYRVFSVFRGASGEALCSPGVLCEAMPAERPPQVESIDYEMVGETSAIVRWKPVRAPGCRVRIFVSSQPLHPAGTFVRENDGAFAFGEEIRACDQERGRAELRNVPSGIVYLTPVTCKDGSAVVSRCLPLLPCVSNLQALRRNGNLELTWGWPKGCTEVRLLFREDKLPVSSDDGAARHVTVSLAEYQRDRAYIVNRAGEGNYYCAVCVVAHADGKVMCSAPRTVASVGVVNKGALTYSFVRRRRYVVFGQENVTLEISSSQSVPDLLLVKKFGAQPLGRNDGTVCLRIPATQGPSLSVPLDPSVAEPGAFLKLYIADPGFESAYSVNHPSFSEMRI